MTRITFLKSQLISSIFASISLLAAGMPSAFAELPSSIQNAIDKSVDEYGKVAKDADEKLLKAFDAAIEQVRKNARIKPEAKQAAIEAVSGEKFAFEKHGTVPFSLALRQSTIQYLTTIEKARIAANKAYDPAIDHYQRKEKDDVAARRITDEKKNLLAPKVVAKWECVGTNFNSTFTWSLLSDGTVEGFPTATWRFDGDSLVLRGGIIDTSTIGPSGRTLTGRSNKGGTFSGKLIDPP